jgi:hypothetical protein
MQQAAHHGGAPGHQQSTQGPAPGGAGGARDNPFLRDIMQQVAQQIHAQVNSTQNGPLGQGGHKLCVLWIEMRTCHVPHYPYDRSELLLRLCDDSIPLRSWCIFDIFSIKSDKNG